MANEKRLIDANALLEKSWDVDCRCGYVQVVDVGDIKDAPTVDAVEVVHARWENVQNGKGCCSNCHRLDSIDNLATHCRYCGAKMDGERSEK